MDYDFSLLKLPNAVDFASFPDVFPACWPTRDEVAGEWVMPEITVVLQLYLDTDQDWHSNSSQMIANESR